MSPSYSEFEPSVTPDESSAEESSSVEWDALLAQLEQQPAVQGWLALDEAAAAAGVSRSTLRSWYRTDQIPSRMVPGLHGPQRLVPLDAVLDRTMRSTRLRRQLDAARAVDAELAELRRRLERVERLLGLDSG